MFFDIGNTESNVIWFLSRHRPLEMEFVVSVWSACDRDVDRIAYQHVSIMIQALRWLPKWNKKKAGDTQNYWKCQWGQKASAQL